MPELICHAAVRRRPGGRHAACQVRGQRRSCVRELNDTTGRNTALQRPSSCVPRRRRATAREGARTSRAGPPPAGIVAAEPLCGPPRPAIAACRGHGPTHGPMQAPRHGPAQSAQPGARPHIPGAHAGSRAYRSRPGGRIPAIRHKALNGRDPANYAGCIRFAPLRVARTIRRMQRARRDGTGAMAESGPRGGRPPNPTT